MNRDHVIKRLAYLRKMEGLGGSLLFLALGLWLSTSGMTWAAWKIPFSAMLLVGFILFQGIIYWHLKLAAIRGRRSTLPKYFKPLFVGFQCTDLILLCLYAAWLIRIAPRNYLSAHWLIASWLIYAFAVLEYMNYYHYQLSHDNVRDLHYLKKHRRIRVSSLASDMAVRRLPK